MCIRDSYYSQGGAPALSYGVYSFLDPGFNGYAGYFQGNVSVFGTFYNGSDDRLKENVSSIRSSLDVINNLQPKQYNFKRDLKNNERKSKMSYGFIAQEVMEVLPDVVKLIEQEGEAKRIEVSPARVEENANGERVVIPAEIIERTEMDGEPMYAVAYLELIPFLVGAIQEQDEKLNEMSEKSLHPIASEKDIIVMSEKIQQSEIEIQKLRNQISQLIDCTDCGDIQLESRKIEFDIDQLVMRLYPNPSTDHVNLEVQAGMTGLLKISVFSESGQLIVADDMMLIEGKNVHRIESSSWTSGMYHITTTFNDVTHSQKVVVE